MPTFLARPRRCGHHDTVVSIRRAVKLDERGGECASFLAVIRDVSGLAMVRNHTQLDELPFFGIEGPRTAHFDQRLGSAFRALCLR
jgi:hypothetical protein